MAWRYDSMRLQWLIVLIIIPMDGSNGRVAVNSLFIYGWMGSTNTHQSPLGLPTSCSSPITASNCFRWCAPQGSGVTNGKLHSNRLQLIGQSMDQCSGFHHFITLFFSSFYVQQTVHFTAEAFRCSILRQTKSGARHLYGICR